MIIGRKTFSSAIHNAIYIRDKTNAIFIGEPTGGKPNHYGDNAFFGLPNTNFNISYSSKYWKLEDKEEDAIYPDILAWETYSDYINGVDLALRKIKK